MKAVVAVVMEISESIDSDSMIITDCWICVPNWATKTHIARPLDTRGINN